MTESMPFLNETLFHPGDTLVVAVSGGIDSMVLLDALVAIKDRFRLTLIVAHVNHHTRKENLKEAELVQAVAKQNQLPCEILDYQHTDNTNFQQAARYARYDFFIQLASKYHANKLVLAHQADDQAETVLMRLVRGGTLSAIAGMRSQSDMRGLKVIRPLLNVSRKQIEAYQKAKQVPYLEDDSNWQDHYTRNRFRHQLLPLCFKENPLFLEKTTQFTESMQELTQYIRKEAKTLHDLLVSYHEDGATLAIDKIKPLETVILRELFTLIINTLSKDTIEVSYRQLQELVSCCHNKKPQMEIDIDQSLVVIKHYHTLDFVREKPTYSQYEHQLTGFTKITLPHGATFQVSENISNSRGKPYELWYNDLDSIFPLLVRNRRPGDRIRFAYGSKKLKTFFIEKKVPQSERETIPLVFSKNGDLLWIPGYYRKRTTPGNHFVRMEYWKGNNHVGK